MAKVIYEDDNWVIELTCETDYNPQIKISSFKNGHFIEDIELSRMAMESDVIDKVKDILYQ